jgi:hypothetical protein
LDIILSKSQDRTTKAVIMVREYAMERIMQSTLRQTAICPLTDPSPATIPDDLNYYHPRLKGWGRIRQLFSNISREDPWESMSIAQEIPTPRTNDWRVHELFDFVNFQWRGVDFDYDAIRPSLALATRLLEEPHFLVFWETVFFGKVVQGTFIQPIQLQGQTFIRLVAVPGPMTSKRQQRVYARFLDMVPRLEIIIQHGAELRLRTQDGRLYQSNGFRTQTDVRGACCGINCAPAGSTQPDGRLFITLNTHHFHEILCDNGLKKLKENDFNPCHIIRAQWLLAETLIHELTHAAWNDRCILAGEKVVLAVDPQFPNQVGFELGHAWELIAFGAYPPGRIYPPWKSAFLDESIGAMPLGGDNARCGSGTTLTRIYWQITIHCCNQSITSGYLCGGTTNSSPTTSGPSLAVKIPAINNTSEESRPLVCHTLSAAALVGNHSNTIPLQAIPLSCAQTSIVEPSDINIPSSAICDLVTC